MSKRVLVVEDYTEARQAIIETLHGYDCIEAGTVVDALAAVEANPAPALVILDLRLNAPAAELHAALDRLNIPVIVVSGLDASEVRSTAEAHPGWRWMTKPVDSTALRGMVAQTVESPAVSNEIQPSNSNSQYPDRSVDNVPVVGVDLVRDRIRVVMDRLLYAAGLGVMAYLAKIGRLDLGNATAVMLVVGVRPHNLFEIINGRNNRASFMLMLGVMGDSLRSGNWLAG